MGGVEGKPHHPAEDSQTLTTILDLHVTWKFTTRAQGVFIYLDHARGLGDKVLLVFVDYFDYMRFL
jgi:hypothetical protein